jgi:hypothetical protein
MEKRICLYIAISIILSACKQDENETKKLQNYLNSFSEQITDYKVICFVPVDGCESCIDPSLNYSNAADKGLLLVLSSIYKKTISKTIERIGIKRKSLICDAKDKAYADGFVSEIAPCYYFLKDGCVIKKVDLSTIADKKSILVEVHKYLKQ